MSSRRPLALVVLLALAVACLWPQTAGAQVQVVPEREFQSASPSSRALLARWIARTGILSLRTVPDPTADDFRLTAHVLELAHQLDPGNLDLLRRQIDAWHGAGDRARERAATELLVSLDPGDRVAQLRLISSRIGLLQTAEDRVNAYDRLLGPAGERIDASIRSRLALDAALLAREIGDDDGFVRRLTQATQLDSSNKDAAVLAATLVLDSSDDALARAEVLLNVIMADPMDGSSHANLTRELRARGAFESAFRFQLNADAIHTGENRSGDINLVFERMLSLWGVSGPEAVAKQLDDRERGLRAYRASEIEQYTAAGREPPPGSPAEQISLEPELEILRVAANLAMGRNSRVAVSAGLLTRDIATAQQLIAEYQRQDADPAQLEQASNRVRDLFSDLLWMRLWGGVQVNEAGTLLDSMRANGLLTDERVIRRYQGFIALWTEDFAAAERFFTPLADADPRARIGLALLEEARGNTRAAASHHAHVALSQTGAMLGLYSRSQIERLLGEPVRPSAQAVRLEEYFRRVPEWLDRMTRDPRQYMSLEAMWPTDTLAIVEGLPLTIRVRNIGRIPLAVGPTSAINSRILLSADASIGGQKSAQRLPPEVVEFSRVLRIMPGETVDMTVQTDLGAVGAILDNTCTEITTLRWQLAQGFLVDRQGMFHRNPLSLSGSTRLLTRRVLSIPEETPEGYRRALLGAQGDRLIEVLLVGRDMVFRSTMAEDRQAGVTLAADFITSTASHMPAMSTLERAAAVTLVGSVLPRELRTPLDTAAVEDPSHLVRAVTLLARINNPDDPLFEAIEAESSESLRLLASSVRTRLRAVLAFAEQQRRLQAEQQRQRQAPGQQPGSGLRFDGPR